MIEDERGNRMMESTKKKLQKFNINGNSTKMKKYITKDIR